jgi:hypothetical protein
MSADDHSEILAQMNRIEAALYKRLDRIEDKVEKQGEQLAVAREGISSLRAVNSIVAVVAGSVTGAVSSFIARRMGQ